MKSQGGGFRNQEQEQEEEEEEKFALGSYVVGMAGALLVHTPPGLMGECPLMTAGGGGLFGPFWW